MNRFSIFKKKKKPEKKTRYKAKVKIPGSSHFKVLFVVFFKDAITCFSHLTNDDIYECDSLTNIESIDIYEDAEKSVPDCPTKHAIAVNVKHSSKPTIIAFFDYRPIEITKMIYNTKTMDKTVGGVNVKDDQFKTVITTMRSKMQTIKQQLQHEAVNTMEATLEDMVNMIGYAKPSVEGLNTKMEQLTHDLEQSRKQLLDMQHQYGQMSEKHKAMEGRLQAMKEENERLTAHTHNLNNDYKELSQHAITALSSPTGTQPENSIQDYATMYHQLQAANEKYTELKEQYLKLKEQKGEGDDDNVDSLRGRVMELEEKLQSQQTDHDLEIEEMQKTWKRLKSTIRNRSSTQVGLPEHLSPMTPESRSGGASKSELFAARAEVELLKDRLREMEEQASNTKASWETAKSSYEMQIKNMEEDHQEEVLLLEKDNANVANDLKRLKTTYLEEKNRWENDMEASGKITIEQGVQVTIPTMKELDAEAQLKSLNEVVSKREAQLTELEMNLSKREELLQAQREAMEEREKSIIEAEVQKVQLTNRERAIKKAENNLLEKEAKLKEERLDAIKNEMYQYEQEMRSSHEKKLNAIYQRENDLLKQKEDVLRQRKELEREVAAHGQLYERESKLNVDIQELRQQISMVEKQKLAVIQEEQEVTAKEAQMAQVELELNLREQAILKREQKKAMVDHVSIQTETTIPVSDPYTIMSTEEEEEETPKKKSESPVADEEENALKETKIFYQPDYIIRKLNQNSRENKLVDQIKQLKQRIRDLNKDLAEKQHENKDMISQMKATGYWNTFVESMENAEDQDHRSYVIRSPTTKKPLSFIEGYQQLVKTRMVEQRKHAAEHVHQHDIDHSLYRARSPTSSKKKKKKKFILIDDVTTNSKYPMLALRANSRSRGKNAKFQMTSTIQKSKSDKKHQNYIKRHEQRLEHKMNSIKAMYENDL